ncbi:MULTISPECIES: hypothetical protein [unclassified Wolbachia]
MKITEYLQFHDKGAGGVCQVIPFLMGKKKRNSKLQPHDVSLFCC